MIVILNYCLVGIALQHTLQHSFKSKCIIGLVLVNVSIFIYTLCHDILERYELDREPIKLVITLTDISSTFFYSLSCLMAGLALSELRVFRVLFCLLIPTWMAYSTFAVLSFMNLGTYRFHFLVFPIGLLLTDILLSYKFLKAEKEWQYTLLPLGSGLVYLILISVFEDRSNACLGLLLHLIMLLRTSVAQNSSSGSDEWEEDKPTNVQGSPRFSRSIDPNSGQRTNSTFESLNSPTSPTNQSSNVIARRSSFGSQLTATMSPPPRKNSLNGNAIQKMPEIPGSVESVRSARRSSIREVPIAVNRRSSIAAEQAYQRRMSESQNPAYASRRASHIVDPESTSDKSSQKSSQ
ncbi:hypothetical protein EDD86DRAFT_97319 [Gorgonomyces haynaldii]|nr:hypothetical protein EDD86DRAFT_97319 [Gorgonomyces haynaldii]